LPGLRKEIADGLHVAGHELMAKAAAIESKLQQRRSGKWMLAKRAYDEGVKTKGIKGIN